MDAVCEVAENPVGDGQRDGRLADASRADNRDEAVPRQLLGKRDDDVRTADHAGQRNRYVRLALVRCRRASRDVSLLPADGDGGDEAVASAGDVRDVAPARVAVAERPAKRGDVNSEARFLDEGVGPDARKQLLLADHLTGPLHESKQDVARAAAETHGCVAFEKQTLRR